MNLQRRGGIVTIGMATHRSGFCYVAPLLGQAPSGDRVDDARRSTARLFEDGIEIGPPHQPHDVIGVVGNGSFSHWQDEIYFSSTDGSDPTRNGRTYSLVYSTENTARGSLLAAAAAIDDATLNEEERFSWAERLFAAFVPELHVGERSRSAFLEADFRRDFELFDPVNHRSYDRKFAMKELFKWAHRLEGEVAECGVFRGASAYLLAKAIAANDSHKRLHLFDSFEGVSAPSIERDGSHWMKGDLACDVESVAANLKVYQDWISYHPGWIPDRFGDVSDRRFCFVHLDVDLYQPTRDALSFFMPRMTPGGFILCDDYGFETCPGARSAMDEAADCAGLPVVHLPTGQGVLMLVPPSGRGGASA